MFWPLRFNSNRPVFESVFDCEVCGVKRFESQTFVNPADGRRVCSNCFDVDDPQAPS